MFDGFQRRRIEANGVTINLVTAGSGPPLLLLHGYPQTHAMWHRVAPGLAEDFTVVVPDLRGYGASEKPPGGGDHAVYTKRTMALDQVEVMRALGFPRFRVAGHDRGARVAYRMALDHPAVVEKLAVLDIVPTYTMFAGVTKAFAMGTYHWFFLAQPFDLPEHLIGGDPEYFIRNTLSRWSGNLDAFAPEALHEYIDAFRGPACIHATCEDYRAGATLDTEYDAADLGKRKIVCPLLALWGNKGGRWSDRDVLAVWRDWADDVQGRPIASGHFLAEEAPDETYSALREFLRA
ncbi:MAG TPA: alpha/beta hydrolase [Dehalococcoidia bacterium]|nr:alpha/beta hydrolase [Dehalococcoidia bacterium]